MQHKQFPVCLLEESTTRDTAGLQQLLPQELALIFWGNALIQIADMALLAQGNLNAKEEKLI